MQSSLTEIIAVETHGQSYRTSKHSIDFAASHDYEEVAAVWRSSAEPTQKNKYIDLDPLCKKLTRTSDQILTYFLDGTRKVFKIDDISYELSGGCRVVYPVMAGQIISGICKRVNGRLIPEKCSYEIVLPLPEAADYDNKAGRGFWNGLTQKISLNLIDSPLSVSAILSYNTNIIAQNVTFEDMGTAAIQSRMLEQEKELTAYLAGSKLLNYRNYLVKDGIIEYSKKLAVHLQNYRWVIGISKRFTPDVCVNFRGKADPGYIADLPVNHRTQVACFSKPNFIDEALFAVWNIRLQEQERSKSPFDGVVRAEKMLTTHEELASLQVNSDEIDTLSVYILNERNPACFGNEDRWANHIYPVYLTEQFIKSKYISAETFLHIF